MPGPVDLAPDVDPDGGQRKGDEKQHAPAPVLHQDRVESKGQRGAKQITRRGSTLHPRESAAGRGPLPTKVIALAGLADGKALQRSSHFVQSRRVSSAAVVAAAGEADMFTAPRPQAALSRSLADSELEVTMIGLIDVEFLDQAELASPGGGTLRRAAGGEPMRVVVDHTRPVIRPLELTGLEQVSSLFHYGSEAELLPGSRN